MLSPVLFRSHTTLFITCLILSFSKFHVLSKVSELADLVSQTDERYRHEICSKKPQHVVGDQFSRRGSGLEFNLHPFSEPLAASSSYSYGIVRNWSSRKQLNKDGLSYRHHQNEARTPDTPTDEVCRGGRRWAFVTRQQVSTTHIWQLLLLWLPLVQLQSRCKPAR